jgi:hypothetical protein
MTRQLAAMHGVAGAGQTLRDEAHLDRCPAEAVHEQHADAPTAHVLAAVRDLLVGTPIPLLGKLTARGRLLVLLTHRSTTSNRRSILGASILAPIPY